MHHEIILYHYWRSSCSWRVRWALIHKEVAYTGIPVNLLENEQNSPAYLAVNPAGYVPGLSVDGKVFGESLAMLEWIEETHPNKPLLPKNSLDRMRVRQMCLHIAAGIQPLQNLAVIRAYSDDAQKQAEWASRWISSGMTKLEELVGAHAGTFCMGNNLSFADLCLVPQTYNAKRFNVSMDDFPTLKRITEHCLTLEACVAASPERQQ